MDEEAKEEIQRQKRDGFFSVAPVFPELKDFDCLLANKFETWVELANWPLTRFWLHPHFSDEHLSKFWKIDLIFAWMRQYKFCHKKMELYKINVTVQCPWESINDSKIPIYFENVLIYKCPAYRGILSIRMQLLRNEFKRALGTDNFTSACPSMNQLFSFLEYYHGHVMKTNMLVDNFLQVVRNNNAILVENET